MRKQNIGAEQVLWNTGIDLIGLCKMFNFMVSWLAI